MAPIPAGESHLEQTLDTRLSLLEQRWTLEQGHFHREQETFRTSIEASIAQMGTRLEQTIDRRLQGLVTAVDCNTKHTASSLSSRIETASKFVQFVIMIGALLSGFYIAAQFVSKTEARANEPPTSPIVVTPPVPHVIYVPVAPDAGAVSSRKPKR